MAMVDMSKGRFFNVTADGVGMLRRLLKMLILMWVLDDVISNSRPYKCIEIIRIYVHDCVVCIGSVDSNGALDFVLIFFFLGGGGGGGGEGGKCRFY